MSQAQSVSKGVVSLGVWSLTKLLVSSAVLPVYSRTLGVEGYGQYAFYIALILFTSHLCNLGMMPTATRFVAERPTDLAWRYSVARFTGMVNLLSTLTVSGLVGLSVWWMAGEDWHAAVLALVLAGVMLGDQVFYYSRGILHGLHREELASIPGAVGLVLSGVIGVLCTLAGMGVAGPFVGLLLAHAGVAVVTLRSVWRLTCHEGTHVSRAEVPVRRWLSFGLSSMCVTWLGMTLYSIDMIMVSQLAGDRQAGLYAAAIQWSQFVWFIPIAVEGVMLQSTARWWAEGNTVEITRLTGTLLRYVVLGCAFLLLLVVVFAEDIVRIYFGQDFSEAATGLRWLAPGVLAFCIARVMSPVIQARGHLRPIILVMMLATVCDLGLCWLLVPRYGAIGAAMATTIVFSGVTMAYVCLLAVAGVRVLGALSLFPLSLLCAVSAAVMSGVRLMVPSAVVAVILGGSLGTLFYWMGVLRFRLLRVGEVRYLVHILPGPVRPLGVRLMRHIQPMLLWLKPSMVG